MFPQNEFTPKFFSLLQKGISPEQIKKDLLSGLIVGIVALPLAIAFGIASGVSPEKGLITAIVAGFIISLLGGSRVQIGGPTGAFIVIVYAIVQEHGVDGLSLATFLAGFMILGMGLLRFGLLLRYIPYPLIVGFTTGIALVIFSTQLRDFFGLSMAEMPTEFVDKYLAYGSHFHTINFWATGLAVLSLVCTVYGSRLSKLVPGSLLAIVLCTLLTYFGSLPVETIGSKFGELSGALPRPGFFEDFSFERLSRLFQAAFAIALLGGIESLLSAVVADGMIGGRHRSNMELVAQGLANIVSGLFGGIPATGAIARTATNVKNGGRTPIAGMVHALVLLAIMVLFMPLAQQIPMACLAGILVVVAYNMSEWRNFRSLARGNAYDRLLLWTVFILTVLLDLIVGIQIGLVLAAFIFMKRMADLVEIQALEPERLSSEMEEEEQVLPKDLMVYEVHGALFFGAMQAFQNALQQSAQRPKLLVLDLRYVSLMDATGIYRLEEVIKQFKGKGSKVFICGLAAELEAELERSSAIPSMVVFYPSRQACLNELAVEGGAMA